MKKEEKFISTTELAKILGISRIAVYKKIKKGDIKAVRIGRNFVVKKSDLPGISEKELTEEEKKRIERAVKRVVKEYRETLRLLAEND